MPKEHRRSTVVIGLVNDIDHAIRELVAARGEIVGMPEGLRAHQRAVALIEPRSRLVLARRFINGVIDGVT